MIALRFLRKVHGTGYYIDGIEQTAITNEVLQYRVKEQDIMQANINDWPWSDWKDVPMGLEQSK